MYEITTFKCLKILFVNNTLVKLKKIKHQKKKKKRKDSFKLRANTKNKTIN